MEDVQRIDKEIEIAYQINELRLLQAKIEATTERIRITENRIFTLQRELLVSIPATLKPD